MECMVCRGDVDEVVSLHCGHGCCECCWSRYVSTAVKDGKVEVGCIVVTCDVKLSEEEVLKYLPTDEEREKYFRFKGLKMLESDPGMRWCRNPLCGVPVHGCVTQGKTRKACRFALKWSIIFTAASLAYYITTTLFTDLLHCVLYVAAFVAGLLKLVNFFEVFETCGGVKRLSVCEECGTESCYDCRLQPHDGECLRAMTEELKTWFNNDDKMRAPCHGCKTLIELYDGCNHMTCLKCGYQFCMLCGEDVASSVSQHYTNSSCRRYNGEMTPEWKENRWDISSIYPKLSLTQQDAFLYSTSLSTCILAAKMSCEHVTPHMLASVITAEAIVAWLFVISAGLVIENTFAKRDTYEPVLPLQGWFVTYVVAANFEWLVSSVVGVFGDGFGSSFLEAVVGTMLLMASLSIVLAVVLNLHLCGVKRSSEWVRAIEPSWTRPLKDLNFLATMYVTAWRVGNIDPYCWTFSVGLCLATSLCCVLGCFAPSGLGEPPVFWGWYTQVMKGACIFSVLVLITVSGASFWILYYAATAMVLVTPLTLCPRPFKATILGGVCRQFSVSCTYPARTVLPTSTTKRIALIVLMGAVLELTIVDLFKGSPVLTYVSGAVMCHNLPVFTVCVSRRFRAASGCA